MYIYKYICICMPIYMCMCMYIYIDMAEMAGDLLWDRLLGKKKYLYIYICLFILFTRFICTFYQW
jgi:hypothetical protein